MSLTGPERNKWPAPFNADVQHCWWYGDAQTIRVHLWGDPVDAIDNTPGLRRWQVRRCVVCGHLDQDYLMRQHEAWEGSL